MFEVKKTTGKKVAVSNLTISDGIIVDKDGVIKDLNKIVLATFQEEEPFNFTINNKVEFSDIVDEEGE